ncbi:copper resistance protein CopC [Sporosarcina sp. P20a]|uniref:copper resistance CopC family protein n=1 Tax=Sporosarcina sp. P20a TaxID=2048256 RepID=UPI000C16DEB2|nr:copper resistance CopC family protein [Sporosarcina sp. P20a]PIC85661.1 copper resistance protein CopC [Sporosarcina sp. P20a]
MKKNIVMMSILLFIISANTVSAHTGLTSATPADGEVIFEEVHEIVLDFNTKIEATSTVKVFNEANEEIIVSTINVNDHVMTAGFLSPLDQGTYTVDWKIIGADGHPIQGTYSFVVNQDELKDPIVSEEVQETPAKPIEERVEENVEQPVEVQSKIASHDVLVIILVVLFTIAGGVFGWIIGRRQT